MASMASRRPIQFVPDVAAAVRFYEALGLTTDASARFGHWIELAASCGELGLHDAAKAADGAGGTGVMLGLVADGSLEDVEARLRALQCGAASPFRRTATPVVMPAQRTLRTHSARRHRAWRGTDQPPCAVCPGP
jgi:hypothetical protein